MRKIAEIKRLTCKDNWCCVPTCDDVADLCSRAIDTKKADSNCIYLKGPTFLYEHEQKLIVTPLWKYCNEVPVDLVCTEPDSAVLPEIDCNLMCNTIQGETNLCCTVPVYIQEIA